MHYDHPGSEEWKNVQGEVLLSRLGLFKESPWCMMPADDMLLYAICDTTGSVLVLWSYLVLQAVLIVLDHVTGDYMDVPGPTLGYVDVSGMCCPKGNVEMLLGAKLIP